MRPRPRTSELAVAVVHAFFGWTIAAAASTIAAWNTSSPNAPLSVHAVVLPIAFILAATVYFRRARPLGAMAGAFAFASTAFVMDILMTLDFGGLLDGRALVLGAFLPASAGFIMTWLVAMTQERRMQRGHA